MLLSENHIALWVYPVIPMTRWRDKELDVSFPIIENYFFSIQTDFFFSLASDRLSPLRSVSLAFRLAHVAAVEKFILWFGFPARHLQCFLERGGKNW